MRYFVVFFLLLGFFPSLTHAYTSDDFVITVDTTLPGGASNVFSLAAYNVGYDAIIDWGDGATTSLSGAGPGTISHTYATTGVKTIAITTATPGGLRSLDFSSNQKLISVEQWGTNSWSNVFAMFKDCTSLTTVPSLEAPNLSNVTDTSRMFEGASMFNSPIDHWDMSNIETMTLMFRNATSFNQPLNSWDVSNVVYMDGVFENATSFNQDLSDWDVSSVQYFFGESGGMFAGASAFNGDVTTWDTSSAVTMGRMFAGATSFNQDISNWDVSSVDGTFNGMYNMFENASSFNQDLSGWNVSQVTEASNMLAGTALSVENYTNMLTAWSTLPVQNGLNLGVVGGTYNSEIFAYENSLAYCTSAQAARDILTATYSWTITDGGPTECATSEVSGGSSQSTNVGIRKERMETLKDAVASTTTPVTATISTFVATLKNLLTYLTTNEAVLEELTPEESKSLIIVLRDALLRLVALLPGV